MTQKSGVAFMLLFGLYPLGCLPGIQVRYRPVEASKMAPVEKYKKADAVILYEHEQILNIAPPRSDGYFELQRHFVVQILTEKGAERYSRVKIAVGDEQKVTGFVARSIDPSGVIHEVDAKQKMKDDTSFVSEGKANESTDYIMKLPKVKVGSRIEYIYGVRLDGNQSVWTGAPAGKDPIVKYELDFSSSKPILFSMKVYNLKKKGVLTKSGGTRKYHLEIDNIPMQDDDDWNSGASSMYEPWWLYRILQYNYYGTAYRRNKTWNDSLAYSGMVLYRDEKDVFDGYHTGLKKAGCKSDVCLVNRALDFVGEKTILTDITNGVWDMDPLAKVVKVGHANNYEKAALLYQALEDLDVDARFAMLTRTFTHPVDEKAPTTYWLNHLVIYLPKSKQIVDPSCEVCRLGQLPARSRDARAIVLEENASLSGDFHVKTKWVDAKGLAPGPNFTNRRFEVLLEPTGDAVVVLTEDITGHRAAKRLMDRRDWSKKRWKDAAEDLAEFAGDTVEVEKVKQEKCNRRKNTCRQQIEFSVPGYGTLDGDEMHVPLSMLISTYGGSLRGKSERESPMFFASGRRIQERVEFTIPDGYRVKEIAKSTTVGTKGIRFEREVKTEGQRLIWQRAVIAERGQFGKEKYTAMRDALMAFLDEKDQIITLVKGRPSSAEPVAGTDAKEKTAATPEAK